MPNVGRKPPGAIATGLLYFVSAAFVLYWAGGEDGLAVVWPCNAILLSTLLLQREQGWPAPTIACAIASTIANALFGYPFLVSLGFTAVNVFETVLAAWLLRHIRDETPIFGDFPTVARFALISGVIVPMLSATAATAVYWAGYGDDLQTRWVSWYVSAALGFLIVTPLAIMLWRGDISSWWRGADGGERWQATLLLSAVAATAIGVFMVERFQLLFLIVAPVLMATFRVGRFGAAASLVIVAMIASLFTVLGFGPIVAVSENYETRILFLQLYLAFQFLAALPAAAALEQQQRLTRVLASSEARYRLLAESATDVVLHLDAQRICTYASPSTRELLGKEPEAVTGEALLDSIHPEDRPRVALELDGIYADTSSKVRIEYRSQRGDGQWLWLETHARALTGEDGRVNGAVCAVRDISDRKALEGRLAYAASTDPLTGLINRRRFHELLAASIEHADAHGQPLSVAMIDLDHFKRVNDTHGHGIGDTVLCGVVSACQEALRGGEIIGRLGGEEFALIMPGSTLVQATEICERLRCSVAGTVIDSGFGLKVLVTVSVGIAERTGSADARELLANADRALYAAKEAGRNRLSLAA